MIDWRDPDGRMSAEVSAASVLRWTVAGLAVLGLHASGIWMAMNWPAAAEPSGDPPAAIMMELAPLAVAPEAPQQDVAPGPQMVEAQEQPEPEPEKPIEEAKPEVEPALPVETEIKPPELPKVEKAEVVLPSKVEPPKARPKPKKKKQKKVLLTTAPPSSQAQRANRAAAPAEGTSSSMSPASWRGSLMAHLNRYKRFPPGGTRGTATVVFTINRAGNVVSARLARTSGDSSLDAEAVSLPRRASPVPAPPPNIGGGSITLTVPIRFN